MTDFTKLRAALEADRIEALEFLASQDDPKGADAYYVLESLANTQAALQALDAVEQGETFDQPVDPADY